MQGLECLATPRDQLALAHGHVVGQDWVAQAWIAWASVAPARYCEQYWNAQAWMFGAFAQCASMQLTKFTQAVLVEHFCICVQQ